MNPPDERSARTDNGGDRTAQAGLSTGDGRERTADAGREAMGGAKRKAESLYQSASSTAAAAATEASDAIDDAAVRLGSAGHETLGRAAASLSEHIRTFSEYIDGRSLEECVADARSLAQRNPALFVAGGIALGFAMTRFFKASGGESRRGLTH